MIWTPISAMKGEKSMPPMNGNALRIGASISSVTLNTNSPNPHGSFAGIHESSTRAKIATVSAWARTLMNASMNRMRKGTGYFFGRSRR